MRAYKSHLATSDSITIVFEDGIMPVGSTHRHFHAIKKALASGDTSEVARLVDVETQIKEKSKGRFQTHQDVVTIDGERLPLVLASRLIEFADQDIDTTPLVAFWTNWQKNRAFNYLGMDLFDFLSHHGIPITKDGCFIAYKRVGDNYYDLRTGKLDHTPGCIVEMPWEDVDPNRDNTCSAGLHVATFDYAHNMYSNGILIEVKVNPIDVVAIPTDYGQQKMRVCKLLSLKVCAGKREEPLYTGSDFEEDDEEEDDDEEGEDDMLEDDDEDDDEDDEDDDDAFDEDEDEDKDDEDKAYVDCTVSVLSDSRINLPANVVKELWSTNDATRVVVTVYEKKLLIADNKVGDDGDEHEALIDHHFNIRLSKRSVVAAGLDKYTTVKVTLVGRAGEERYIRVSV